MKKKINFTIPQHIIDHLCKQLDELEAIPWDEREVVTAAYDEDEWYIECSLTYDLQWTDIDEPGGRTYSEYAATPMSVSVEKCRYYHDPEGDPDNYTDYSEQLENQLIDEIQPEL